MSQDRVELARRLGHPAFESLRVESRVPAEASSELSAALDGVLPPQLVMTWAVGCAARALDAFEAEYHQEPRAGAIWEAARAALDGPTAESRARLEAAALFWPRDYRGCRVAHQPFWPRVLGRWTRGQVAGNALRSLRNAALAYVEPAGLWETHEEHSLADGYDSPESRLLRARPSSHAARIARDAARAAGDHQAEVRWQRSFLAQLVLAWETWDEDLGAWRARVEGEWVPRVRSELKRARFDKEAYLVRIADELVPRA